MNKKLLLFLAIILAGLVSKGQNIQLHYDMGEGRGYLTSTVEMFKADKLGSTFFFIDMDYNVGKVEGISFAYWEVARALKFWEAPFALHVEYNGGFGRWQEGEASGSFPIEDCWLSGLEYSRDAEDYSKGFTIQVLHKYIRGKHDFSFQLTGVWYWNFLDNRISFTGFIDYWREDFFIGNETTKYVFQAEPQIWYNINNHISFGGEAEIDNNFAGIKGFKVYPTIGAKYTF